MIQLIKCLNIILSTLFFVIYLAIKNECWDIQNDLKSLTKSKIKYSNNIKSLNHKKYKLIQSIENRASKIGLVAPDPQPIVISMGGTE